jgi:hypothetical protein
MPRVPGLSIFGGPRFCLVGASIGCELFWCQWICSADREAIRRGIDDALTYVTVSDEEDKPVAYKIENGKAVKTSDVVADELERMFMFMN